jgi:4-hydroxybutyrate dehydrogenase
MAQTDYYGSFSFPTRIEFGPGTLLRLPSLVEGLGTRALIVTDTGVVGAGIIDRVSSVLVGSDLATRVFEGVEPNPDEQNVAEALERYLNGQCDLLIAVGGGSPMDVAKAVRLLATHPGPLAQYDDLHGGSERIGPNLPPLVCIPTTAGTGSEVGRSAVITIAERKTVLFSPYLLPTLALCDPELTLDLPARPTAGTGADALTHNLEAFLARGFHPLCDAIALDGMRRARRWLPVAVRHGSSVEARAEMMLAALMGAIAFQKGLGVAHSLAHPLSTVAGAHHGTANALMLPHAIRFNAPAVGERINAVAEALRVPLGANPDETAELVAADLAALFAEIGLPSRLRELNVTHSLVEPMAALAMQDGCHRTNPRPVTQEEMRDLYLAAL